MGWLKKFSRKVTRPLEKVGRKFIPKPIKKLAKKYREPFRDIAAVYGRLAGSPITPKSKWGDATARLQTAALGYVVGGPVGAGIATKLGGLAESYGAKKTGLSGGPQMGLFDGGLFGGGGIWGQIAQAAGGLIGEFGGRDARRAASAFGYGGGGGGGVTPVGFPGPSIGGLATGDLDDWVESMPRSDRARRDAYLRGHPMDRRMSEFPPSGGGDLHFRWRKRRRINPLNPAALRHAISRANGFARFVKRSRKALTRVATAVNPGHSSRRRPAFARRSK